MRESKTFERRSIAAAWIEDREALFARPGAIEAYDSRSSNASKPTLADAIDRYVRDSHKTMGRTKTQVLNAIKTFDIAALACDKIGSSDIVD
ncbi:MAG: site-specific integrase, partial [Pseudomonadota bacterium]